MCPPPLSPEILLAGRYRVVAPLGRGGTSEVWEAVDERLGRAVAVKSPSHSDPTDAARLRSEAAVLARVRHPNLVAVHDSGEHAGRPFVVTELVRGQSLADRLRSGPLDPDEAAALGAQVAAALACVHAEGIVHRDLKPANVLLDEGSGEARLIDFGIAVSEHSVGLTGTGLVIGTPAYLSPEQVEGRRATSASDVYSLGLVLLEAMTGRRAFPGTPTESAGARLANDVPLPAELEERWRDNVRQMTRREADERPSAAEVVRRLRGELEQEAAAPTVTMAGAVGSGATEVLAATPSAAAATPVSLAGTSWDGATGPGLEPAADAREERRRAPLLAGLGLMTLVALLVAGALLVSRASTGDSADTPATVSSATVAPTTPVAPTTEAPTTTTGAPAPPTTTEAPGPPGRGKPEAEGNGKGAGKKDD